MNTDETFLTDIFDGLQVEIDPGVEVSRISYEKSGWVNGSGNMRITPTQTEALMLPWKYNIVFNDNDSAYVAVSYTHLTLPTKRIV